MEVKTTPKRRVCISLPRKYMAALEEKYELDHGLFIKGLNPCLSEAYVQGYFREWGTVTSCKIRRSSNSGETTAVVYVMFSTEDEADRADWAGPHFIGGSDVEVRRVVSPKMEEDPEEDEDTVSVKPRPRRSMGLGYILEDAQWLEDEEEDSIKGQ